MEISYGYGTLMHKNMIAMIMNKSRGAYVMDSYMDKYDGIVITEGYNVYKRFDPDIMHQRCWAHEIHEVKHTVRMHGDMMQKLYEDLLWIHDEAKKNCGRSSMM